MELMMILRTGNKKQGSGFRVHDQYPEKGFTLIEVMVAVSILAVGLVGVLRAYATSATAMEKVQYEMDAVFLLKTVMGRIDEKAITQGALLSGTSSGEFTSDEDADLDIKSLGQWCWNKDVRKMDLPTKKAKPGAANKEVRSDKEKRPEFYLNELKLTVANSGRSPLREISLETYVGIYCVQSS
jgi:prepilin-type N-terminal cleavage/methylation domain-containing protein